MELQVLGPLTVVDAGREVEVRGARQGALLALLAVHRNQAVSVDRLLDEIWGSDAPNRAANTVQAQISQLRKLVGPDAITLHPGGYVLRAEPGTVDADRFEHWIDEGLGQVEAGRHEAGSRLLERALSLWRGAPFGEAGSLPGVQPVVARLTERQLQAREARIDAELALGRHLGVLAELEGLCTTHPLREGVWRRRMLALYRAGRQADALRAYGEARSLLVEELGIEPGPELRQMEALVLAQSPQLDLHASAVLPPPAPRPTGTTSPRGLRRSTSAFVGREDDLRAVRERVRNHRLVTVIGPGGMGKTRLATEVALAMRAEFGDGVFLVELADVFEPEDVIPLIAVALDPVTERVPALPRAESSDALGRLVDGLTGRELLVVLDNCEHLIAAVASVADVLLASTDGVRVLATSREALALPGESRVSLGPLELDDAVQLFAERAGALDPTFDVEHEADRVRTLCERLDGLPLAVELAAARVRSMSVEEIMGRLDDRFALLAGGTRTAQPRQQTLRALVDWSYELLEPDERCLFDRLAIFSGGWTLDAAEEVCAGDGLPARCILDALTGLVDKSLVQVERPRAGAVRFQMLQTIWAYARERLSTSGLGEQLARRHAQWCSAVAQMATEGLRGATAPEWRARVVAETPNLRAALDHWIAAGEPVPALRLPVDIAWSWFLRADWHEGIRWLEDALAVPVGTRPDESASRARAEIWRAYFGSIRGGMPGHVEASTSAVALLERCATDPVVVSEGLLLHSSTLEHGQRFDEALEMLDRAHHHLVSCEHHWGLGMEQLLRTNALVGLGRIDDAERTARQAIESFERVGESWAPMEPLGSLAAIADVRGDLDAASAILEDALAGSLAMDLPSYTGPWMFFLGRVRLRQGRTEEARSLFDEAAMASRSSVVSAFSRVALARLALLDGDLGGSSELLAAARQSLRDHHAVQPRAALAVALGWAAFRGGDLLGAQRHADAADDLVGGASDVLRAAVAAREGDLGAAVDLLARAGSLRPAAPILAALDDLDRTALEDHLSAISASPQRPG